MPPPPLTATTGTGGTKKRKKKKAGTTKKKKGLLLGGGGGSSGGGGGGIKIQPFARPPSLPAHFYEASVSTLLRALGCVLREEPLYVDADVDGELDGEGGAGGPGPGRGRPCASSPKSAADPMAAATGEGAAEPGASPMDLDDDCPATVTAATTGPTASSPNANAKQITTRSLRQESLKGSCMIVPSLDYSPFSRNMKTAGT